MNLLLLSVNPAAIPDFLDESVPALDRRLRLGYISDAATGSPFANREHTAIAELGHDVIDVSARGSDANGFAELLDTLDAMYVASGETFVLLEALRSNGTGDVLAQRIRGELPYIGCSAGSIIAGPSITPAELMDDRGVAPTWTAMKGWGSSIRWSSRTPMDCCLRTRSS